MISFLVALAIAGWYLAFRWFVYGKEYRQDYRDAINAWGEDIKEFHLPHDRRLDFLHKKAFPRELPKESS